MGQLVGRSVCCASFANYFTGLETREKLRFEALIRLPAHHYRLIVEPLTDQRAFATVLQFMDYILFHGKLVLLSASC